MKPDSNMTEEQIEALVAKTAEETAKRVVSEMFIQLGIDVGKPTEMQADMIHLRAWRNSMESVKRQGLLSAIALATVGILTLIWTTITRNPPGQ